MGTLLQSDAGYLFALDNDVIMNEPNEYAYIKSKRIQECKDSLEDGMSLDEISEVVSNRLVDLIKKQLTRE